MSENNSTSTFTIPDDHKLSCRVCEAPMYVTDHGNHEVTFHCSSEHARFWDYDRGTEDQMKAKEHWDKSRHEVYPNLADAMTVVSGKDTHSVEKGGDGMA
jgi:hypothetical protein